MSNIEPADRGRADNDRTIQELFPSVKLPSEHSRCLLDGASIAEILLSQPPADIPSATVQAIARRGYCDKNADDVSGSGYVVRCLEAALW